MASALPNLMVIKAYYYKDNGYAHYKDNGSVVLGEESVFSTLVKIEVERATNGNKYVHLRFSNSNKYWQKNASNKFIVAQSNQPEEDTSKSSCTLFEPVSVNVVDAKDVFYLKHVQSGGRLRIDDPTLGLYVDLHPKSEDGYLTFVDWDTLVKLPSHIALKGSNDKYIEAHYENDHNYLKFSSTDPNNSTSGHQVQLMPDGHVIILSDYWTKYWFRSPNWIWGGALSAGTDNIDTLFWPVKIDDTTIALQCPGNNQFCVPLTKDKKKNCLNAAVTSITNEARLAVTELVLDRSIYNVRYRMEDSRIFDEKPYIAGTTTATNNGDQTASIGVSITYQDVKSYSFNRSLSITAGVSTTIKTDVLGIAESSITFSFQINTTLQWGNTTTNTTSITANGSVPVPPRSVARVTYVGTKGTCNVPFNYTQQDKSSKDGKVTHTEQIDGVFDNVNCYNFSFVIDNVQSI